MTPRDNAGTHPVCACRRDAAAPAGPASAMRGVSSGERRLARRPRGAAAWALPTIALALIPKCPMCIVAYLAIGGGLGVSFTTAAHLRTALVWLCWSVLALLVARMAMRFNATGKLL